MVTIASGRVSGVGVVSNQNVIRVFQYSLRPTETQEAGLYAWLGMCRELYNAALQERRSAYSATNRSPTYYEQCHDLAEIRQLRPEFAAVSIHALRGTLRTLDRAFKAFFRRCKRGEKPGYPRFKGRDRTRTLVIEDLTGRNPLCAGGKRVHIPLLGKVRLKLHRPMLGTPKSMRITYKTGRWYVSFQCVDVPKKLLPATGREAGVDLGLTKFATTSEEDDRPFENPRALRSARIEVERAQRRVTRKKRGSNRRRKEVQILGRKHAHISNVRRESAIQMARALVKKYDAIYVENLNIKGLARGLLSKSVHDAGWGISLHWLDTKAEEAGRLVGSVDPAGTSIDCSGCGKRVPKELSERTHRCSWCGLHLDRDVNAAKNIKTRGLRVRREALGRETSTTREERTEMAQITASDRPEQDPNMSTARLPASTGHSCDRHNVRPPGSI